MQKVNLNLLPAEIKAHVKYKADGVESTKREERSRLCNICQHY